VNADVDISNEQEAASDLAKLHAKLELIESSVATVKGEVAAAIEKHLDRLNFTAKPAQRDSGADILDCADCGKTFRRDQLKTDPNCLIPRCASCVKAHACGSEDQ